MARLIPKNVKPFVLEVKEIINEIGVIANTTHGDRYIFGGTNTMQKPYDAGVWQHNTKFINYEIRSG